MGLRNIIFDLDGTLIDSSNSIIESIRSAIEIAYPYFELPTISKDLIGPSIRNIIESLIPCTDEEIKVKIIEAFKLHYDSIGCLKTMPYDGIDVALNYLADRGHKIFIATNKRSIPTQKIINHLGWLGKFRAIYSVDLHGPTFKDKASMVQSMMEAEGLNGLHTYLVGDSLDDYFAAKTNNLKFLRAAWGYGGKNLINLPHTTLNAPSEIIDFFKSP